MVLNFPYVYKKVYINIEILGIKLKNNIVIIDEAHNLLEAIAQMYSSEITYMQLYYAQHQLKSYKNKFSKKFSSSNLLCINQLLFVVTKLFKHLGNTAKFKILL